jgi:Leu/Phe-tRNA-protein transferase
VIASQRFFRTLFLVVHAHSLDAHDLAGGLARRVFFSSSHFARHENAAGKAAG